MRCLIAAERKVATGHSVLNYVACAMEGDLPDDAEQWRALYVQAYHITRTCQPCMHEIAVQDRCRASGDFAIDIYLLISHTS